MNHHHNPPPPPNIRHTTAEILRQTTSLFWSHLLTFLFISTLLLTCRFTAHSAPHYLSSLIDRDPTLKKFFSRNDLSDVARLDHRHRQRHRRHRRRLQISPVGILDDDFFGPSSRKSHPNATLLSLSGFSHTHGFSNPIVDNCPAIVKPGMFNFNPDLETKATHLKQEGTKSSNSSVDRGDAILDLGFLIKGLELKLRDAPSLFYWVGFLCVAYASIVHVFIATYSRANGVIFLKLVDHLLGNDRSFCWTFTEGSIIGLRRLMGLITMKWAVKDAFVQLMGFSFYRNIEVQPVYVKVFWMLKFVPFSNSAPWVKGHEWYSAGFIVTWFFIDLWAGLFFSVGSSVAIVDVERDGREIVRKGHRILAALFNPALEIRWLEAILCGPMGRWVLRRVFGEFSTLCLQSLMEVYFMLAWLVFYFASRQIDDAAHGRVFGRRELERAIHIAR